MEMAMVMVMAMAMAMVMAKWQWQCDLSLSLFLVKLSIYYSFFSFSFIVILLGLIFGDFWPPAVPQTRPRVPIQTLDCGISQKTELDYWFWHVFFSIFLLFWSFFGVFNPLLRPKYPHGPHMDWYPKVYVFSRQLTKIQILFETLVHFFHFLKL